MNNGTFEKITKEKKFIEKLVVLTRKCNKKKHTSCEWGIKKQKKNTQTHTAGNTEQRQQAKATHKTINLRFIRSVCLY